MLPFVLHPTRTKATLLAAVLAAACAACAPMTPDSGGRITPVNLDCGLQEPMSGVLAEIPGFTVTEICSTDVDSALATQEFDRLAAALVSQDGNPILRVLGGRLKNGGGDPFLRAYVGNLSNQTPVGVGVPSEPAEVGGHLLTHFNIPLHTDGYAYAEGPKVVIAYVATGAPPATVEAALAEILDKV
jgi:hypothetical protein